MTAPHPAFTAMVDRWDPVRREQARTDELARQIDQYAPRMARDIKPARAGDLARQKRNKR